MKKIEYDLQNGIYEVNDFDDDTDISGPFSDHFVNDNNFLRGYFGEDFEGTRGMEVGDKLFDFIDKEYGIKKL
jgi:hypothetical protein